MVVSKRHFFSKKSEISVVSLTRIIRFQTALQLSKLLFLVPCSFYCFMRSVTPLQNTKL